MSSDLKFTEWNRKAVVHLTVIVDRFFRSKVLTVTTFRFKEHCLALQNLYPLS